MQRLAELRSRALRTVSAPSAQLSVRPVRRIAAGLLAVGLLTVSWERLGNLGVGGYNVKLPVLLFTLTALLAIPGWLAAIRALGRARPAIRVAALLALVAVLIFAVRALTSFPLGLGVAQGAAVATGAVAPALAVLGVVKTRQDVLWALRWLVAGAVVAGVFGLYQLLAFYTGLPQGVEYTGVGTSGAGGRISAFSYEPAYFAYFLVLAVGAVVVIAHLTARRVSWPTIAFFALVLVLVNVRALIFLLPLFAALLALEWRRNRMLLLRGLVAAVVALGLVTAVTTAIVSVLSAPAQEPSSAAPAPSHAAPTTEPTAKSELPAPPQLPGDVLDPSEPSSNGPRLDLYKAVLQVDLQHPIVGVGPGHLRDALAANGYVAPNQGANVVANNIWLQAVADGGVILLLVEGALLVALGVVWWRFRRTAAHPAASALLAVLLVGGMLTSYFFDIKVWVMLALVLVLASTARQETARDESASA